MTESSFDLSDKALLAQIPERHSVRSFTDRPIEGEVRAALERFIAQCNDDSDLSLQLITDEPGAFSGMMARYGNFSNVRNYIACIGPNSKALDETVGFWGERCVLAAQALGLNSCWVALTYSKGKVRAATGPGQKLACVIALGYGVTAGQPHKIKTPEQVVRNGAGAPPWFADGVRAALLAPTAMNQQKFTIDYDGGRVLIRSLGGPYSAMDLGIVKAHFELGAGVKIA